MKPQNSISNIYTHWWLHNNEQSVDVMITKNVCTKSQQNWLVSSISLNQKHGAQMQRMLWHQVRWHCRAKLCHCQLQVC